MGKLMIDYGATDKLERLKERHASDMSITLEAISEAISLLIGHEKVAPATSDIIADLKVKKEFLEEEKIKFMTFYLDFCDYYDEVLEAEARCIKSVGSNEGYPTRTSMDKTSDTVWREGKEDSFLKDSILYCAPGSGALGIPESAKSAATMAREKKKKKDKGVNKEITNSSVNPTSPTFIEESAKMKPGEYIKSKSTVGDTQIVEIASKSATGKVISYRRVTIDRNNGEVIDEFVQEI